MHRTAKKITISSGTALSDAVEDLRGYRLAAIQMPAAWDAADLTFDAKATPDGTFQDVHDSDGTELKVSAAAGRYINLGEQDVEELTGMYAFRVRSGTTGTAVNQSADRELTLILVAQE